jgi:hypothetical protein
LSAAAVESAPNTSGRSRTRSPTGPRRTRAECRPAEPVLKDSTTRARSAKGCTSLERSAPRDRHSPVSFVFCCIQALPGPSGSPYDPRNFRRREFEWAREAAGIAERDAVHASTLRHLLALAAGIPPSDVARFGGTSVTMLERVYAHLLEGSAEAARRRLDTFAASQEHAMRERLGHSWTTERAPAAPLRRRKPRVSGGFSQSGRRGSNPRPLAWEAQGWPSAPAGRLEV